MKKIALIMDGWMRFITFAWASGILERINEKNQDVNLYIFNSNGNWSKDNLYNHGEYNIYHLPNFSDFDGIILDISNVKYDSVKSYIIEKAAASKVPTITIGNEFKDFYYAGIDNYSAMTEMISHIYTEHNARTFWFIMGAENNYDSNKRATALLNYVKEHNIPESDYDFYYESFEYLCGKNGFNTLLKQKGLHNLPDAIICANDNIAVGVCMSAAYYGLSAPSDFLLTGFDDFDKARYYSPRISTISYIREDIGRKCADIFFDLWKGKEVPRHNYTVSRPIFWESCTCKNNETLIDVDYTKNQINYNLETSTFDEEILGLEYELMSCKTVSEMIKKIPLCIPSLKCDGLYLVMDSHLDDSYRHNMLSFTEHMNRTPFSINDYPDNMYLAFSSDDYFASGSKVDGIFPVFNFDTPGSDFLFLPIHFREQTVGYFAIRNAIYLMEQQYLFQIMNVLTTAIENLYNKERLSEMNEILSTLYIQDSMTSMYNRLGFTQKSEDYFNAHVKSQKNFVVIYLDLDRLKYINDNFGHEMGDLAIRLTAKAILNNASENGICFRLGGDEFLVMDDYIDTDLSSYEEYVQSICKKIEGDVSTSGKNNNLPFSLSVSIGYSIINNTSQDKELHDLDYHVKLADVAMYNEKTKKKIQRTQ